MDKRIFTAAEDDNDRRIDRVVRKFLPAIPLSGIYSALRKKRILLNDGKTSPAARVYTGDRIAVDTSLLDSPRPTRKPGTVEDLPAVLFESPSVLAVNKPRGISVHGEHSLERMVYSYLRPTLRHSLSFSPGPLHRLDRNTSGLVFFGKSLEGARRFSELLGGRNSGKYYIGLFNGVITDFTRLSSPVDGKKALSFLYPLASAGDRTLGCVRIITGRKHQIRVQAAEAGHPLAGDTAYGGTGETGGYLLHSYAFVLNRFDDILGLQECRAPLPRESEERLETIFGPRVISEYSPVLDDIISKNQPPQEDPNRASS